MQDARPDHEWTPISQADGDDATQPKEAQLGDFAQEQEPGEATRQLAASGRP
ncbi:hypothetical protein [Bifidobacterium subtile]|uniref:hypothetical protein n=1 Tax=Bifidobacterium subtile TaxID=77635 RepID=UPI002F35D777